jgi:LPXTG-site transpeptidase (sortase) family protein
MAFRAPRQETSPIPASIGTSTPSASPSASPGARTLTLARSVPTVIRIPAIGVSAPVMKLGLDDGALAVPPLGNHNLAGWYEYGAAPGQEGPAVMAGHIDSSSGPSVFYRLRDLKDGDKISITLADGQVATFAVTSLQQAAKAAFPTEAVYGPVSYAALRLITCGGTFDYQDRSYLSNVVVFAVVTSGTAS